MSDAMEGWLLPPLMRALDEHAPNMRIISLPVQFRTVPNALATGAIDLAITVADELPASVRREPVITTGYVCMFDPRHVRLSRSRRLTEREYFDREHVIVSYNGDLRGIVEDYLHKQRRVRCAVSSFSHIGAVLEGSALLATVPSIVAQFILRLHPGLRITALPVALPVGAIELLWPASSDDDDAAVYVRQTVRDVCRGFVEHSRVRSQPRRSRRGRD